MRKPWFRFNQERKREHAPTDVIKFIPDDELLMLRRQCDDIQRAKHYHWAPLAYKTIRQYMKLRTNVSKKRDRAMIKRYSLVFGKVIDVELERRRNRD